LGQTGEIESHVNQDAKRTGNEKAMRRFDRQIFLGNGRFSEARCVRLREMLDQAISDLSALQQGYGTTERERVEFGYNREALIQDVEDTALDIAVALTGRKVTLGRRLPHNARSKYIEFYYDTETGAPVPLGDLIGNPVSVEIYERFEREKNG
jgi:hypothetical protein